MSLFLSLSLSLSVSTSLSAFLSYMFGVCLFGWVLLFLASCSILCCLCTFCFCLCVWVVLFLFLGCLVPCCCHLLFVVFDNLRCLVAHMSFSLLCSNYHVWNPHIVESYVRVHVVGGHSINGASNKSLEANFNINMHEASVKLVSYGRIS